MANNSAQDADYPLFREIVRELKRMKSEENLDSLDDNMLFDGAVRIYNSLLINRGIDMRSIIRSAAAESAEKVPMTEKQKKLLQKLQYRGDMAISKDEAARLIEERLSTQRDQPSK